MVTAGETYTCALLAGGSNRCWGTPPFSFSGLSGAVHMDGELQHGCVALPARIECAGANDQMQSRQVNLSNAVQVSVGYKFSCALFSGGNAKCWGQNNLGQLGNGTVGDPTDPLNVMDLAGATVISSGESFSCALAGGTVKCWGQNGFGTLGKGNTGGMAISAEAVPGLSGVTALAVGTWHTCAVVSTNAIKCWGHNDAGQLCDGSAMDRYSPVTVVGW